MPYIGLIPFLLHENCRADIKNVVSMPYIGLIPFLRWSQKSVSFLKSVSMPYIGLIPFLRACVPLSMSTAKEFQCPTSGLSHFSISLASLQVDNGMFQCPTSGLSHFSLLERITKQWTRTCFNALHRAYPISLALMITGLKKTMFQCPTSGLSHFSLGSREPLPERLPRLIFAGNCIYNFEMGIF